LTKVAAKFANVDEYVASFPEDVRAILEEVRRTIRAAVPDAGERISYGMAAFTLGGRDVVYFAGWKNHFSVYPEPDAGGELARELAPYRASKGTLKFAYAKSVPYELIERVARLLAEQRGG